MKILIVIPARFASTRFPGKPLAMLGSRSLIQRVYEQVRKSPLPDRIVIASDDDRIINHSKSFGAEARMTSSQHPSGTHRCEEVLRQLEQEGYFPDVVVNVQGDEPMFNPDDISLICSAFKESPTTAITTLIHAIDDLPEINNPSIVKVVCNRKGEALYFSRSPIPFNRDQSTHVSYFRHLGVYAFRPDVLREIVQLKPGILEEAESLEQLRWLENGYDIRVIETPNAGIGIDNPWDIDNFAALHPLD